MLRSNCWKHGQTCYLLRNKKNLRRICNNTLKFQTRFTRRRIFYVTGAGAGSCCAFLYLAANFQEYKDAVDILQVATLSHKKVEEGHDDFFKVGYEDEWLACPIFSWDILFKKPSIPELLTPWEQSSSENPWVLLQLTRSQNFWIRQMGIASLADKSDWDDFKYRNIAQACDLRTIVGLARYPYANDAFFLSPPKLAAALVDIISELQGLIEKMPPPSSANSSIQVLRMNALQKPIHFQKDPLTMDLLTQLYSFPGEEQKKKKESLICCLQALQAYTMEQSYAKHFAQLHGLATLQRVYEEYQDDETQMFVLSILANLSLVPELVEIIVKTGWIYELRRLSKGSKVGMSILALTIMANLDRDWITHEVYQDMVLLHPVHRNSHPVYADIVLVHGVRGGAVKTWRQKDSENIQPNGTYSHCWPKDWLPSDFKGVRILSVGYDTSLHQWADHCSYEQDKRTIEGRCQDLIQKLRKAGVGNRPLIWMGHSLGGLLIKQILVNAEEDPSIRCLIDKTKGILMYSVPHKGSGLVDVMMHAKYVLFPSVEVQELTTSSPTLKDLHNKFLDLMAKNPIPFLSFGENLKTDLGRPLPRTIIVPKESSDPGIGQFVQVDTNHIESCKPFGQKDPIYQNTKSFIQSILTKINL